MSDQSVDGAVVSVGPVSLTRLERTILFGAGLALVGMTLPWRETGTATLTGFTYGPISPILVSATVTAGLVALVDGYETGRHALIALDGITLAAWGSILVLGIPSQFAGVGLYVTTLGGLLVTGAGYIGLLRRTGPVLATAIVCGGALAINLGVILLIA